jgi:ribose 5-phosphate isomerase A
MNMQKSKEQIDQEKREAARTALRWVRDGMALGLGTGSTADYFIQLLGERIRTEGLKIEAVASSNASTDLARRCGVAIVPPRRGLLLDLTVDGTDEVTPDLSLIKGRGAALVREKVLAQASRYFLVVADASKRVAQLGACGLPVEVVPFALPWVTDQIAEMGGEASLLIDRLAPGNPAVTDQQNYVLDCKFGLIAHPEALAWKLERIPGVVGHGLFLGYARAVLIAEGSEVLVLRRGRSDCVAAEFADLP